MRIVEYIKENIRDIPSGRCFNLFHCLNELNDHSLGQTLHAECLSEANLSPARWSSLVFVLLTSKEELDVFDQKIFSKSQKGLLRVSRPDLFHPSLCSSPNTLQVSPIFPTYPLGIYTCVFCLFVPVCLVCLKSTSGFSDPVIPQYLFYLDLLVLTLACSDSEPTCRFLVSAEGQTLPTWESWNQVTITQETQEVMLLSAGLVDPHQRLEKLKYVEGLCQTVFIKLFLSEKNRKVTRVIEEQPYPDHPERFDYSSCADRV
ncbi:unnamed protein product [Oncorhynchus mykiss]|uniref:SPRY-associated domain-containing protein n=1 Tax=Oncorhynchus mykiss TaxID=8022 RepID=A0A060W9Q3_ONCMY|nr:unnamed protein product [Oncorhynchus mykiss]